MAQEAPSTNSFHSGMYNPESNEAFRLSLIKVLKNRHLAEDIDKFFFDELANSNLGDRERKWVMSYFYSISLFLRASDNLAKRSYPSNIIFCYERARTLCTTSKSINYVGTRTILSTNINQPFNPDYNHQVVHQNPLFGGNPQQEGVKANQQNERRF